MKLRGISQIIGIFMLANSLSAGDTISLLVAPGNDSVEGVWIPLKEGQAAERYIDVRADKTKQVSLGSDAKVILTLGAQIVIYPNDADRAFATCTMNPDADDHMVHIRGTYSVPGAGGKPPEWNAKGTLEDLVDLDVDSNNNGSVETKNPEEDEIENPGTPEEIDENPGKVFSINDSDIDNDGIIDFCDGFDANNEISADDELSTIETTVFIPMELSAGNLPEGVKLADVKYSFSYTASDPAAATVKEIKDGDDVIGYSCSAPPGFRIWKDNKTARNKASAVNNGDFIPSGTELTAEQAGMSGGKHTYYVEATPGALSDLVSKYIQVTVSAEGQEAQSDTVRVNPICLQLVSKGFNSSIEPAGFVGNCLPKPVISLKSISENDVSISGNKVIFTLKCDYLLDPVADNFPRGAGDIQEVGVYLNDSPQPIKTQAVKAETTGLPPASFWQQNPYKGKFEDIKLSIPLKAGINTLTVKTGQNAAGLTGYDEVRIFLHKTEKYFPEVPAQYISYNIAFFEDQTIRDQISVLENQLQNLNDQLEALKTEKEAKDKELADKQTAYDVIGKEIPAISKEITATNRAISKLKTQLKRENTALKKILKKKPLNQKAYDDIVANINRLNTEIAALEKNLVALNATLDQKEADRKNLRRDILALNRDIRTIRFAIPRKEKEITALENKIKNLEKKLAQPDTSQLTYYVGERTPTADDPVFIAKPNNGNVFDGKLNNQNVMFTIDPKTKFTAKADPLSVSYPTFGITGVTYVNQTFYETGPTTNIFRRVAFVPGKPARTEVTWKVADVANCYTSQSGPYKPITLRVRGLTKGVLEKFALAYGQNGSGTTQSNLGESKFAADGWHYLVQPIENTTAKPDVAMAHVQQDQGARSIVSYSVQNGNAATKTVPITAGKGFYSCIALNPISQVAKKQFLSPEIKLIPDYNHDRVIDEFDKELCEAGEPFRFWINDDSDSGTKDVEGVNVDVPAYGTANHKNNKVDGRRDLVDFFPVFIDLNKIFAVFPPDKHKEIEYKLRQDDGALKMVYTQMSVGEVGGYQISETIACGSDLNTPLHQADTVQIPVSGVVISDTFLGKMHDESKGVLVMEGCAASTHPLILEIWQKGIKVLDVELPLNISPVEKMFTTANLRAAVDNGEAKISVVENFTKNRKLQVQKQFVFVHGYNSSEYQGRGWASEIFKRMYWSGSLALYHGILWDGDESKLGESTTPDYQANVINAFQTGSEFATYLNCLDNSNMPVTVAAHSLGNGVTATAIADYNAKITDYFMINAAIAAEAYDATEPVLKDMWHNAWESYYSAYSTACQAINIDANRYYHLTAAGWHNIFKLENAKLKPSESKDKRAELTWKDRFANNPNNVKFYNFYSSGEEVLDIHPFEYYGNLGAFIWGNVWSYDPPEGRYAWSMQEKLKGGNVTNWVLGSYYGGWDFNRSAYSNLPFYNMYSADQAYLLTDEQLKTEPFFDDGGPHTAIYSADRKTASKYAEEHRHEILARMIPALTPATGRVEVKGLDVLMGQKSNFNIQTFVEQWPQERLDFDEDHLKKAWFHSDLKDVAYIYTFRLYNSIVAQGKFK